jgi:hypothetical protein
MTTGGPLRDSPEERRGDERLPILGALQGEVMVFEPMSITEIGPGGIQAETAFPLHLDSIHEFRLSLGDRPIVVRGRVTHCAIIDVEQEFVRYRSGIEFVELPERLAQVISSFVNAVKDGRRGA